MVGTKANLVITDPPYNVNYEGSAGKIKNDNMAGEKFYEFLLAAFKNMESVMAADASIYVFHADTEGLKLPQGVCRCGILFIRLLYLEEAVPCPRPLSLPVAA